ERRIGGEVSDPDDVALVHIDRISLRVIARQLPAFPCSAVGGITAELAAVPFADPKLAPAVRPDAPRPLVRRRRLNHLNLTAPAVDPGEIAAGQGYIINITGGRRRDAIGSTAFRGG